MTPTPDTTARTETAETVTVPRGPLPEGVVTAVVCDYLKMAERDPILREIGPVSLRALWSVLATHFAAAPALSPQHPVGVREALERVPVAWMNSDHVRQYQENTSSGIFWASPVESDFYDTALFITAARSCVVSTSIPEVSNAELAQMALCQVAWIEEGKAEHPHRLDTIRDALARLAAISHPPAQDTPGAVKVKALNDDDFPKEIYVQHPSDADFDGQRWSLHDDFDGQHKAVRYVRADLEPSPPLPEAHGDFGPLDGEPDYPDMEEHEDEPLEEALREILTGGQGDDDGPQIMPDFEEGESVLSMVHACIALLETRRDVIEGYANTEAQLRHRLAAREKAEQVAAGLREAPLPRLDKEMIRAACEGHYGKRLLAASGGVHGVGMTVAGRDYFFPEAFQRMWAGVRKELAARAALRASTEGKTATPSLTDEEAGR